MFSFYLTETKKADKNSATFERKKFAESIRQILKRNKT